MSRTPIVAGNWKMFKSAPEAKALVEALKPLAADLAGKVEVAVCPPFTALETVAAALAGSKIALGAQNCHVAFDKDGKPLLEGAFTGEVSPKFLKAAGCQYVILGHSERRQYFGETDEGVNRKAATLREVGLTPIICVGETYEQRLREQTLEVVSLSVKGCLYKLPADFVKTCVIAYEPVWAIGTGLTATPEQAQEVHAKIRETLKALYGPEVAQAMRLQYGGSVKPENAAALFSKPDIDGGLIGGAALKAEDFSKICHGAL
jgi:triosephosphate isomerase